MVMTHKQQELEDAEVRNEELPQPRFEDEATLLSARPVVPLHRVKAYARSKGVVRFVFALLTAGILGAMTAILLSNWNEVRSNIEEDSAVNVMSEVPQLQPTSTKEVVVAPRTELKEQEADDERRRTERNEVRERRREQQADVREQQRESRERQREARRRQREEREEANDDLLRIREIFEGRPRPDR